MQLAPVLMALRDTRRPGAGHRRHLPVRVGAPAPRPSPSSRRQIRAHVAGEPPVADGLPAPDRVQRAARDRRLPRQRLHQGGVEGRHREPQDPGPAGPADLVHGRPRPGLRQPLRGRPRRDARPDHARARARAVRRGPGRRRPGRPGRRTTTRWRPRPPAATRSSSAGSAATCRSPTTAAWRSGSSRTTCARARPRTPSRSPRSSASATGSSPRRRAARARTRGPGLRGHGVTDAERRAALEAIAAEVRDCTRCRLHATRTQGRAGRGRPGDRGRLRRRGPGLQRGSSRAGRSSARAGDLLVELLGSIGWRREDVFITNVVKCRPPGNRDPRARRDRGLRAVPAAPARGPRSGGGRDARPLLDGHVHARRPDLRRRTARSGRSIPATGAPRRAGRSRCTTRPPRSGTPAIERETLRDDIAARPGALLDCDAPARRAGAAGEPTAAEPSPAADDTTRSPAAEPSRRRRPRSTPTGRRPASDRDRRLTADDPTRLTLF